MAKMKRKEVIELFEALHRAKHYAGVKYAYAVARNIENLKGEVNAIREADKLSAPFQKYEAERIELCKKFCMKDDSGNPVIGANAFRFAVEVKPEFDAAVEELRKQHSVAIEARTAQEKAVADLLEEDVDVEIFKVAYESLPELISGDALTDIIKIVSPPKPEHPTE